MFVEHYICASGSVVEHLLAKEGVAGSIPVSRSFLFLEEVIFRDFFAKRHGTVRYHVFISVSPIMCCHLSLHINSYFI